MAGISFPDSFQIQFTSLEDILKYFKGFHSVAVSCSSNLYHMFFIMCFMVSPRMVD